ncbi:FRG domain-containing protein [Mycoplasmatota bacterium]|nr:FRG domain-containing protein [Mycoplasmatota bacterium]
MEIKSLKEYINEIKKKLKDEYSNDEYRIYFRGEDSNYQPPIEDDGLDTRCLPKAFRGIDEKKVFYKFIRHHPEEFSGLGNLEILSKMQHFGIPTRLLDITTNPLVALFFACGGADKNLFDDNKSNKKGKWKDNKGYVYIFKARTKTDNNLNNILAYDSDRALLLSTLAKMSSDEKIAISEYIEYCIGHEIKEITNNVLEQSKVITQEQYKVITQEQNKVITQEQNKVITQEQNKAFGKFIYECERERDAFKEHRVNPDDLTNIFYVKSSFNSLRIKLQSGLFIIFGLKYNDKKSIDIKHFREKVIYEKGKLSPIVISENHKKQILGELKFLCGISYSTLYGDIDASLVESKEKLFDAFKDTFIK